MKKLDKMESVRIELEHQTLNDGEGQFHSSTSVIHSNATSPTEVISPNGFNVTSEEEESTLYPPICKKTLKELDDLIINSNVQVLHDLLMEPNLKVKPNIQRRSTPEAKAKSERYWELLERDIQSFQSQLITCGSGKVSKRMVLMLEEIKIILIEMYPDSIKLKHDLGEFMDVDLIVKDLTFGNFDIFSFAQMLHDVLKINCAPRRDKIVEELVDLAKQGQLISMLKVCFELLELMKLDMANYQLSNMRPNYEKNYVTLEQKYFKDNIVMKPEFDSHIYAWMNRSHKELEGSTLERCYVNALVSMLSVSDNHIRPPLTFKLDGGRILSLRREFRSCCLLNGLLTILDVYSQDSGKDIERLVKPRFKTLLSQNQTPINRLVDEVILQICHINKRPVPQKLKKTIVSQINDALLPGDLAFLTIESQIKSHLTENILNGKVKIEKTLKLIAKELEEMTLKIRFLAQVNFNVHCKTYQTAYEKIN